MDWRIIWRIIWRIMDWRIMDWRVRIRRIMDRLGPLEQLQPVQCQLWPRDQEEDAALHRPRVRHHIPHPGEGRGRVIMRSCVIILIIQETQERPCVGKFCGGGGGWPFFYYYLGK